MKFNFLFYIWNRRKVFFYLTRHLFYTKSIKVKRNLQKVRSHRLILVADWINGNCFTDTSVKGLSFMEITSTFSLKKSAISIKLMISNRNTHWKRVIVTFKFDQIKLSNYASFAEDVIQIVCHVTFLHSLTCFRIFRLFERYH